MSGKLNDLLVNPSYSNKAGKLSAVLAAGCMGGLVGGPLGCIAGLCMGSMAMMAAERLNTGK